MTSEEAFRFLDSGWDGLPRILARQRLVRFGPAFASVRLTPGSLILLLNQFRFPVVVILGISGLISFLLGNTVVGGLILVIILLSGLMGFRQELRSEHAGEDLWKWTGDRVRVLRQGEEELILSHHLVPGDIVIFQSGDCIPGDLLLLDSEGVFTDSSILTGEAYLNEKSPGVLPVETPFRARSNMIYEGERIVCGKGKALVTATGAKTSFWKTLKLFRSGAPETDYLKGIRDYSQFLLHAAVILFVVVFLINIISGRFPGDSALFSLALAITIIPYLLPVFLNIVLSLAIRSMNHRGLQVRHPAAVENLGSLTVLCCDKTGTLTVGELELRGSSDFAGNDSKRVRELAFLSVHFQDSVRTPFDEVIQGGWETSVGEYGKVREFPFDFGRNRSSLVVADGSSYLVICRGGISQVLEVCSGVSDSAGSVIPLEEVREEIDRVIKDLSLDGYLLQAVAYREGISDSTDMAGIFENTSDVERGLILSGFILFFDPPRSRAKETVEKLREMGVEVKVLTGDNRYVTGRVVRESGFPAEVPFLGEDLRVLSDDDLDDLSEHVNVFAELEAEDKGRIVSALLRRGHVVGYFGDGINDVPGFYRADTGISVGDSPAVIRSIADLVIVSRSLTSLSEGILLGRRVLANTLKFIRLSVNSSFRSIVSLTAASIILPFLPLLARQILLATIMTGVARLSLSVDRVEETVLRYPLSWDIDEIRVGMLVYGGLGSLFDLFLFLVIFSGFGGSVEEFRTIWFLVLVVSGCAVIVPNRTRVPVFRSQPGIFLIIVLVVIIMTTFFLPLTPFGEALGFVFPGVGYYYGVCLIALLYGVSAEFIKTKLLSKRGLPAEGYPHP